MGDILKNRGLSSVHGSLTNCQFFSLTLYDYL